MHTLSDLGDGRAQDLARLLEVAHVGRLGPDEAAIIGALLGLPSWAIEEIPNLAPGQAVWKVGPNYVDIIETVLNAEEIDLTDTSSRRRKAQGMPQGEVTEETSTVTLEKLESEAEETANAPADEWTWEMPPNVLDRRHYDVIEAARQGRCGEAADLSVLGEREDIRAYGISSDQAIAWLSTRAAVADLCGSPDTAVQLRATVTRMGKEVDWWVSETETNTSPAWHGSAQPPAPVPHTDTEPADRSRRGIWRYVAVIAALAIGSAVVWTNAADDEHDQEREAKAAQYKGRSAAKLNIDGVETEVAARWTKDRNVIVQLSSYFEKNAKYLRIDSSGTHASSIRKDGWLPKDPEIKVSVKDPLADVTVRVAVGGKGWKEGTRAASKTVRLSPTGRAIDADSGKQLPPGI
jgi:hypothetical protein